MNLVACCDNVTSEAICHLAPHKNMIDINTPNELSKVAAIPKPCVSTIANWLHYPRVISKDPVKESFLASLANMQ